MFSLILVVPVIVHAQTGVAIASAILDVSVTASSKKGVLVRRMTEAERSAISSPATGLLVYQPNSVSGFYYHGGSSWTSLAPTKQDGWQAPALSGGWSNYPGGYSTAGYFRDKNGIVHLRGVLQSGTGDIVTLPVGYRPSLREIHLVQAISGTARVDVEARWNRDARGRNSMDFA